MVTEVDTILKGAKTVVFVNFHALNVANTTNLRRTLRDEGVGFKVAKKTLLKRALATQGITGTLPELTGEVAIAYGEDLLAPARATYGFQSSHKDTIAILGGVFEGSYLDQEKMLAIATIPPLQTLRGMFVNLINTPIQQLVVGLSAIADKKSV